MAYKEPRSIQVILYSQGDKRREFLLLKRLASHGGFWQFVTGSLEAHETRRQAAVREVFEETGRVCREADLIDLHLTNVFAIAPAWRNRFAPGVTHNEEVCFALQVEPGLVQLDEREHEAYGWFELAETEALLYWESSRKALAKLLQSEAAGEV